MNKKTLIKWGIGGAAAVLVLMIALVIPYYLGIKAEQSLKQQYELLANTSFLSVEKHEYRRGWFSSSETTVLRFKSTFLATVQQRLPENVRKILQEPITLQGNVRHGLFAGSLKPVRARIDTDVQFTPEVKRTLTRFFEQQTPIQLRNTLSLTGGGQWEINMPAFDYEELSGIKLVWQGLQSKANYDADFQSYDIHTQSPGLKLTLADFGEMSYQGLDINTHTEHGQNGLALGNSRVSLKQLDAQWGDGVNYDIRLNELINMVSELQIGAFINPVGSVPPGKIVVEDLSFATHMQESGEWINSNGSFEFGKLRYGSDEYGPLVIDAAAEHLQAKSLLALKNKLLELSAQKMPEEKMRVALIQAAREQGLGLFTHNPVFKLNQFHLQMPQGVVAAHGSLALTGLEAADLHDARSIVRKTDAVFDLQIPDKLLETMAIGQMRNLISIAPGEDSDAIQADLDETIRLMVSSTIRVLVQDGYITSDKNLIKTTIQVKDNRLLLNGKPFEREAETNAWENESDTASMPKTQSNAASAVSAGDK
ncbi:YdgA family protein [Stenoxybacter acetivorans]|uniref:YdgA family protein n=1 Tax=Stenoxybacter acetivorans TaxID=422441 RepID=UPI00068F7B1C|nr:YdgA family protein [Stenoxybacter acetivorans]